MVLKGHTEPIWLNTGYSYVLDCKFGKSTITIEWFDVEYRRTEGLPEYIQQHEVEGVLYDSNFGN